MDGYNPHKCAQILLVQAPLITQLMSMKHEELLFKLPSGFPNFISCYGNSKTLLIFPFNVNYRRALSCLVKAQSGSPFVGNGNKY